MSAQFQPSGYPTQPPAADPPWRPGPVAPPGPPNNMGWAIAAVLFFWPISFAAITAASRVDSAWLRGDVNFAMAESERAKRLGKRAIVIAAVAYALFLILYVTLIVALVGSANDPQFSSLR